MSAMKGFNKAKKTENWIVNIQGQTAAMLERRLDERPRQR